MTLLDIITYSLPRLAETNAKLPNLSLKIPKMY